MKVLVIADDDSIRHEAKRQQVDLLISCGDIAERVILEIARRLDAAARPPG